MTSAVSTWWRAHFTSILTWAVIVGSLAVGYIGMLRTRPLYVPDSSFYLGKAFWFAGHSQVDAQALVAEYAATFGIYNLADVDLMFGWGLVQPRVVLSALAAPFVAVFGPIGLAVTTALLTLALTIVLSLILIRRYGSTAAVAVMLLVNTSTYLMWFNGAMLTESLSALLTAVTLIAAWRYVREPRAWLLVVMAALVITAAFTRQATLIVAGAFVMAWLLGMLVGRSWRSPWMWPAIVVGATSLGTQILQSVIYAPFSQVDQFLKQTQTDSLGEAILAVPQMARNLLAGDLRTFLAGDRPLLVLILIALAAIFLFWRRSESHLLVGALLAIALYNITNGTATAFRYAIPGLVFYVVAAGLLVMATAGRVRRSTEDPSERPTQPEPDQVSGTPTAA